MTDEGLLNVAKGINEFTNDYFKELTKAYPDNLITSSLSAQIVLAMATYGAAGKTAAEMESGLHLPKDNQLAQSGYQSLIKILNNEKEVVLRLANKIYTASHLKVESAYKEMTTKNFLSSVQKLNFNDPVAAAQVMNDWCKEQTNNRITNVISPISLPRDTLMILVNVVYFKGQWKKKFDPLLTKNRIFHIDKNTTKRVPTMYIEKQFRFGDLPKLDARFIEVPYQDCPACSQSPKFSFHRCEDQRLSLIIILPNLIDGLERVKENLHTVDLKREVRGTFPDNIKLYLPKFRIENNLNLVPILEQLGMTSMFRLDQANFSGITADGPLNILSVIQSALIEVDEEGSEAFAITRQRGGGPPGSAPPPPLPFKVDRPFYFAIYHLDTGISLFTGIVQEPLIE